MGRSRPNFSPKLEPIHRTIKYSDNFKEVQPPKKAKKRQKRSWRLAEHMTKLLERGNFKNRSLISSAGNVCILLTNTPSDVQCSPSIWQLLHGLHRALSVIVHNFLKLCLWHHLLCGDAYL